ncbi:MAG: GNAT family N-acetyltransferase [Synergistaceae bacterium]|nr:GNAT family N-acetyltransferase [Synergistaceae bacterium]
MIRFEEKENERNYAQVYEPYTGEWVENDTLANKQVDFNFYDGDVHIGYMQFFEGYDDEGELDFGFVMSFEIFEAFRNKGYGTQILKMLAQKYGKIYLCPTDEDNERLYARIGEEIEKCPEMIQSNFDTYKKMFLIEG